MELAIVSDTHWRDESPELERLLHRLQGADYIIHAGDLVSLTIYRALERVAPVLAVSGNCCQMALREFLPWQRVENLEGLRLGLLHGHRVNLDDADAILESLSQEVDLCVHGHTHLPRRQLHGQTTLFNPGSVSEPRYGSPASYGWALWQDGKLQLEHRTF